MSDLQNIKSQFTNMNKVYLSNLLTLFLGLLLPLNNNACQCNRPHEEEPSELILVLQDITYDLRTGNINYTIGNQSKKPLNNITLYYQCKTPTAQIAGKTAQQVPLGNLAAGVVNRHQVLGILKFNGNTSVQVDFWLTHGNESTLYNQQTITFTDIQLSLIAVGPTVVTGNPV